MKLYFVTVNPDKAAELSMHFLESGIDVQQVPHQIQEILHLELDEIVRQKALSAYRYLSRPCVVEHGGVFVRALNDLPGGLTKEVWETVGGKICDFLGPEDDRNAVVRSVAGYCDGRRIHLFRGETQGSLPLRAAGQSGFGWDPIFIPEGSEKTFAEMSSAEKAEHAPLIKTWNALRESLAQA